MTVQQPKAFEGKVALVTGGSKGIGAGIVRRLATDGASVAFTYLKLGTKSPAARARNRIVRGQSTSPESRQRLG